MQAHRRRWQSGKSREYKFSPWIRFVFVIISILIITIGTIIWIYLGPAADIIYAIFVGFSTLLAFFTVFPLLFSSQRSDANSGSQIIIQVPQIQSASLLSLHKIVDSDHNVLDITTLPKETPYIETELTGVLEPPSYIWNVPHQRNPFFTGRENILNQLYDTLKSNKARAQPQAISGLGGIGKTQIAVEYTYRYRNNYQAVLWARADSYESLAADFVTFANVLSLLEKDIKDQSSAIFAVKHWLETHDRWLLILDNADDLTVISNILPLGDKGHCLLTTRAQATGEIAKKIDLQKMKLEEGALFLLRRTNIIALDVSLDNTPTIERIKAEEISKAMDGFPLALDQAGAYIEETACGLSNYLDLYRMQQAKLLQRRGRLASDHPESIHTTLKISLEKVKQASRTAANLLQFFAFLYPDAIPEEIIIKSSIFIDWTLYSTHDNTDALFKLDMAIEELRKYSLVHRNPDTQTLTIHRLVQTVLKNEMSKRTQRKWAKRAVRALHKAFPDTDLISWQNCQRYLPHVKACAGLIDQWRMKFHAAPCLLRQAGDYSFESAEYTEAELLYNQALSIFEKTLGPQKYNYMTMGFYRLGNLYKAQGKYIQAESFYQKALTVQKKIWVEKDLFEANILNKLASLYKSQGKYAQAESLYRRALTICERRKGSKDYAQYRIDCLTNLAWLYLTQDKYDQAQPLLTLALESKEQVMEKEQEKESESPDLASSLNKLASLYRSQGKYAQAEPLYQKALAIQEKALGPEHPSVANTLYNLAHLYAYHQEQYIQAEPLYQKALAIQEKALGPEHPSVADTLDELGGIHQFQGQFTQAELFFQKALAIQEKALGPEHPSVAFSLYRLAGIYHLQGRYTQAEPIYQHVLTLREQILGSEHPEVAVTLASLARLYKDQSKYTQAELLYQQALTIREQILGPEHLDVATVLENYADLLKKTQREADAMKLEARAKAIRIKYAQNTISYASCQNKYDYD